MPPRRGGRSASRRNTPVSPPKSIPESAQLTTTRRGTRSQSRDLESVQKSQQQLAQSTDLTALEEEEDDVQLDRDATPYEDAQNAVAEIAETGPSGAPSARATRSPSALPDESEISDVDSAEEAEALDRDLMVDSLPQLHDLSNNILALLSAKDDVSASSLVSVLQSPGSKLARRLNQQIQNYMTTSYPFGGKLFIRPKPVLNSLLGPISQDEREQANPESVLYLANLASFTASIVAGRTEGASETLEYMFNNFPLPFMPDQSNFSIPDRPFVVQAASIGVDLCTQFFIRVADAKMYEDNFDPDVVLAQAFFNENESPGGLPIGDAVAQRYEEIREHFGTDATSPVDLDALRARYPFDAFKTAVILWAQAGRQDLSNTISSKGGVHEIVDRLQVTEDPSTDAPQMQTTLVERSIAAPLDSAQVRPERTGNHNPATRKSGGLSEREKASIADLRRLINENTVQKRQSEPILTQEVPQSPSVQEEPVSAAGEEADDQAPIPTQELQDPEEQNQRILEILDRQAAQSNKENRQAPKLFIDRQESAQRLTWEEAGAATQSSPKRRRLQQQVEHDDEEEEDFETDHRAPKRARQLPPSTQRPLPQQLLEAAAEEEEEEADAINDPSPHRIHPPSSNPQRTTNSSRNPQRAPLQPVLSSQPASSQNEIPTPSQHAQNANRLAKVAVASSHEVNHRYTPQVRVAYSPAEIERLLDMIALHRTQWALILKEDALHPDGPRLQGRSQVQLKDKARNMKMDFLKASQVLPEGFASVSIGKKGERVLEELGVSFPDGEGGRRIRRKVETVEGEVEEELEE